MREWLPTKASARGRLVLAALDLFGKSGLDAVGVAELAEAATTTTGPLYHHFGSKLGLYRLVRADVERRACDRMEGALSAQGEIVPALVVAFDYIQSAGFMRLVGEPHPAASDDPIAGLLTDRAGSPLGGMLAAAWREGLLACADGTPATDVRRALARLVMPLTEVAERG